MQKRTGIFSGLRPFVFSKNQLSSKNLILHTNVLFRDYYTLPLGREEKCFLLGNYLLLNKQNITYRLVFGNKTTIFITSEFQVNV